MSAVSEYNQYQLDLVTASEVTNAVIVCTFIAGASVLIVLSLEMLSGGFSQGSLDTFHLTQVQEEYLFKSVGTFLGFICISNLVGKHFYLGLICQMILITKAHRADEERARIAQNPQQLSRVEVISNNPRLNVVQKEFNKLSQTEQAEFIYLMGNGGSIPTNAKQLNRFADIDLVSDTETSEGV
jgi:hypothetical protein